jgi:hypothetical protein
MDLEKCDFCGRKTLISEKRKQKRAMGDKTPFLCCRKICYKERMNEEIIE